MRAGLLALAVLVSAPLFAQTEIPWGRAIEWSDFKGHVPRVGVHDAYTSYRIKVDMSQEPGGPPKASVSCVFTRSSSWATKEARKNEALLAHERLHFDIGEVHARMLRSRLASLGSDADLEREVRRALKEVTDASRVMQEQYDRETGHGIDSAAQARWAEQVQSLLAEWSAFALP